MQRRFAWAGGLVLGIGLWLAAPPPAPAVITRLTPLSEILKDMNYVFLAEVEVVYPDKPAVMVRVDRQYKGKVPFQKLPINLTGDSEAKKGNHSAKLLKRLAPRLPMVIFANQRGKTYTVFAFSNGTWFQVKGRKDPDSDRVRWAFTHGEPGLRRTFAGSTAQLQQIVRDCLAGKKKPPMPNAKEKPGFGPEIKPDKKSSAGKSVRAFALRSAFPAPGNFPLAVIPTLGIGGPLAILAMLFPGLFGGALLVFRNWIALLTVAGINSTLLAVYLWFGRSLEGSWIGTPLGLWFAMTLVTMAGTFWSWRRQLANLPASAMGEQRPTRSEQVILWITSLVFVGSFLWCWFGTLDTNDPTWKLILVFAISFSAGTLYVLFRSLLGARRAALRPGLPTDGIILWSMIISSTCLAATWPVQPTSVASAFQAGDQTPVKQKWLSVPPGRSGFVVSSCLVDGNRVYVALACRQGAEAFGALYCLNADTGKPLWPKPFDNDGELKQVFSTPCIADGRLYIGEGFHEDKGCKLFCLNAKTGKKIWDFQTDSHTESSPCVAGGKVFFGAGDDGVYCLTTQGKKVWQYPGKKGDTTPTIGITSEQRKALRRPLKLHVDANPVVVGNRLYIGSGIDRDAEEPGDPAVFCLDARTGEKIWLKPLLRQDLPAWASAAVAGNEVFFGLGNGDILQDTKGQASTGALLCVATDTGKELWRYAVPGGVLKKPRVLRDHVFFGCRDGRCYCLDRQSGKLRWKNNLESPIVTSPALFHCDHCGTERLYVLGAQGRVRCFDPDSGLVHWTYDLPANTFLASSPQVAVRQTSKGEQRRLYFGAGIGNQSGVPGVFCLEDK